jgi:LacI family transcriptional regulator
MKKQVTIKDIANELKIHHTTVSRALRNHPDINKETKKKGFGYR